MYSSTCFIAPSGTNLFPLRYVLSPTHLHEFKTADKSQAPIMSLYLPEQKLGSHSEPGSTSNKFMLKGRQTGSMHRGHSWVFRAESYDTMMAWYEDIKSLTEAAPQERNAFVRSHARSFSGASQRASSISSDGVMDEEDEEPFSTEASAVMQGSSKQESARRPEPGGRFPSDIKVDPARGLQVPLSPSSASSSIGNHSDRDAVAAAAALSGSGIGSHYSEPYDKPRRSTDYARPKEIEQQPSHADQLQQDAQKDGLNPYTYEPIDSQHCDQPANQHQSMVNLTDATDGDVQQHDRQYVAPPIIMGALQEEQQQDYSMLQKNEDLAEPAPLTTSPISHEQLAMQEAATIAVDDAALLQQQQLATGSVQQLAVQIEATTFDEDVDDTCHRYHDDLSMRNSEMHVPGEYPAPTPVAEESLLFSK